VGDEGVGKTSLVRRFVLSEFSERYVRTVGVVIHKRIVYLGPIGGRTYEATLTIWDLIGREEFASQYGNAYLANVAGVLAVCDVTRRETLEGLDSWLQRVRASARVPAIVLANKIDATDRIRVSHGELADLCKRHGVSFLETSARTGQNVGVAFSRLGEAALRNALAARLPVVGAPEELAPAADRRTG